MLERTFKTCASLCHFRACLCRVLLMAGLATGLWEYKFRSYFYLCSYILYCSDMFRRG